MFSQLFIASAVAALASAATIQVDVSNAQAQNVFSPNSIKAAVGDQIVFQFHSSNHAVGQSSLSSVCGPVSGGFYSGYPNPPSTFTITVNTTDPIFNNCPFQGHCQQGMAGVINPVAGQTISDYTSKAASVSQSGRYPGNDPVGGTLGNGNQNQYSNAQTYSPGGSSGSSTASAGGSTSTRVSTGTSTSTSTGSGTTSTGTSTSTHTSVATASSAGAVATQVPAALAVIAGVAALL